MALGLFLLLLLEPQSVRIVLSRQLAFEGDSLTTTRCNQSSNADGYWGKVNTAAQPSQYVNVAVGGRSIQDMATYYTVRVQPYKPTGTRKGFASVWGGTNDITGGRTAMQIEGDLTTWWAAARADGWLVIAWTISPRAAPNALTAPQETIRTTVNTWIRGQTSSWDILVDSDVLLPDATNATYYCDGLHMTIAAETVLSNDFKGMVILFP